MISVTSRMPAPTVSYPCSISGRSLMKPSLLDTLNCRWRLAIQCLLAVALLASCSNRTELDDSVAQLTFKTLSGEQLTVSEATGPLLINFWSTSCVVCIAEMPDMAQLYEDYVDRGLELVAVSMPYDPPNHVLELAQARQLPFPVALDVTGEAVDAFGDIQGTPTTFLLDAEGRLVKRYIGAIPFEGLRKELDQLLGVS